MNLSAYIENIEVIYNEWKVYMIECGEGKPENFQVASLHYKELKKNKLFVKNLPKHHSNHIY
jgi:hypothetical protein